MARKTAILINETWQRATLAENAVTYKPFHLYTRTKRYENEDVTMPILDATRTQLGLGQITGQYMVRWPGELLVYLLNLHKWNYNF